MVRPTWPVNEWKHTSHVFRGFNYGFCTQCTLPEQNPIHRKAGTGFDPLDPNCFIGPTGSTAYVPTATGGQQIVADPSFEDITNYTVAGLKGLAVEKGTEEVMPS